MFVVVGAIAVAMVCAKRSAKDKVRLATYDLL